MYPKMLLDEYTDFKSNLVFLNQMISLCNECFTNVFNKQEPHPKLSQNFRQKIRRIHMKTECDEGMN